jgi:hypothetical protein
LRDKWLSTRQPAIDAALGYQDQNALFFSVEELQAFLDYVRSESTRQNITKPGIRIFFGAYSGEESNLATVFLAPTDGPTITSNNNYNIRPLNYTTNGMPPTIY